MTKYSPWKGKFLAYEFVKKFRDDYFFLLPFLCSEDEFLRVSAVELLGYLCCNFEVVPNELLALQHPLPDLIKSEIDAYWAMKDEGIETVGDLLRFDYLPDGE